MGNITDQILSQKIYFIRGLRVMLDSDLAALYEVATYQLNQQVKRNLVRFPSDFMFQLTDEEYFSLNFQAVISKKHGGRRKKPLAFTEQGVAMLSSVLNSERAALVNIEIMRTFVRIRKLTFENKELNEKIKLLERKYSYHDEQFKVVFEAIREIIAPSGPLKKRRIGL